MESEESFQSKSLEYLYTEFKNEWMATRNHTWFQVWNGDKEPEHGACFAKKTEKLTEISLNPLK